VSEISFDTAFVAAPPGLARALDPSRRYDALVLGAGPAGIAAAIYLVRKGVVTGVIAQSLGGQVAWTAGIENYPGYRLIDGAALVQRFREQVEELPPDLALGLEIWAVSRDGDQFRVRAGGAEYAARTVIVATGKRPRLLGVPGERRLLGRGVAFCATCDAPLYRGKVVGVVGGGNSGIAAALDLARVAQRVSLFQDQDRLTADPILERRLRAEPRVDVLLETAVTEVLGDERVRGVRVRAAGGAPRDIPLEGLFVEIGLLPNSEPVRGLAPLNARGEIEVDCACRTTVPGLFAAGDVTGVPYKQIVIAAGEGAKAALSACDYLAHLEP
jgi:alkyl hydroperoxide reductase subunit F